MTEKQFAKEIRQRNIASALRFIDGAPAVIFPLVDRLRKLESEIQTLREGFSDAIHAIEADSVKKSKIKKNPKKR